ncbi:IQ motif [Macleaya cordata]|uniref:IQ motif n=1 Tax=Macleaya cordata TaxID=56857 RepID=A0A200QQV6_MACCD|nr:IQ motif [Macleaya cordata]
MVTACLKIIACGSDSANKDDELERIESKGSTDKRGWSFRKRSTSHRGLSNNIIPDIQSTGNKEYTEPTNFDFHAQSKPAVPGKISALQWPDEVSTPLSTEVSKPAAVPEKISVLQLPDEVTPLSTEVSKLVVPEKISALELPEDATPLSSEVNSNTPDPLIAEENAIKIDPIVSTENSSTIDSPTTLENVIKVDLNLEEPVAIVLQSAIRGYLAKRSFLKLKNVVKLQAAVRGLLVRRQAVGTLLCVQAIVKMQALVRARRAQSLEGSVIEEQLDEKQEKSYQGSLIKVNPETKAKTNYSSTQILLRNGFARQLLESTPKKKQIRIKCDPSRPDSSWKWFDRWTTVSSSKFTQPQKPEFSSGYEEQGERIDSTASEVGTEIPAEVISESADLRSNIQETTMPIDVEENLTTYHADDFYFQVSHPTSSSVRRENTEQTQLEDDSLSKEHETSSKIDKNQTEMQFDDASQTMADSDCEQLEPSVRSVASEQPDNEDKKMFGSRKASNPAFIAAKSKFEDLSLRTISGRSLNQDSGLEMKLDSPSFPANAVARTKEHSLTENSISYDPRVYVWGSECGTELSISSTLDSPDRFEIGVGVGDFDNEIKVAEKVDGNLNEDTDIASNLGNLDVDAKNDFISQPISPYPDSCVLPGKVEDGNRESVDSAVAVETPIEDQKPERTASDVQTRLDATKDHEAHCSSLDGSPGNNITATEPHGTPSSKVSVKKPKKKKQDKNGSPQTRKSQSAGKKSPSNANPDSGARSSTEQLPKDPKNGKKRSSFGSARLDHVELEPRDSSSNSLPSYMQATESARAKAHVNNSPRSRSDVQDKDIYIKKRHSLPANGKQGSPRVQPSTSERQQGANGNHTRSPCWVRSGDHLKSAKIELQDRC